VAATRRAEENRVRNFEMQTWVRKVAVRAEAVEAEPPLPRAQYPTELKSAITAAHAKVRRHARRSGNLT